MHVEALSSATDFENLHDNCRFPKLISFSHLKCHLNVINDKKVGMYPGVMNLTLIKLVRTVAPDFGEGFGEVVG